MAIKIDGKQLNNLQFTDDILLFNESKENFQKMVKEPKREPKSRSEDQYKENQKNVEQQTGRTMSHDKQQYTGQQKNTCALDEYLVQTLPTIKKSREE